VLVPAGQANNRPALSASLPHSKPRSITMSKDLVAVARKNLDTSVADAVAKCEALQQCLVEIVARLQVVRDLTVTPQSGGGQGEEEK
jgi:hypothetical protein